MPKSWETVTTILESMPSKELTMYIAKTRLRSEVERRGVLKETDLGSTSNNIPSALANNNTTDLFYNCGKPGHLKMNCQHLQGNGCTDHMVNYIKYFIEFMYLKNPINIALAKNNNYMKAIGVGNINVEVKLMECDNQEGYHAHPIQIHPKDTTVVA
ncbi:unnamed protein product [Pieris macdunnoughi]|uniref:Retrovirus-related Pol polyprotein from transposon TNT 1-94-like beta-barrel domain-containing protein n=1 Tax=Pieris macdunnoughi TaxID=345717 RepID=A0A821UH63_9NEOP|nr:unnamed protein product [Pieris macdunnoughi]